MAAMGQGWPRLDQEQKTLFGPLTWVAGAKHLDHHLLFFLGASAGSSTRRGEPGLKSVSTWDTGVIEIDGLGFYSKTLAVKMVSYRSNMLTEDKLIAYSSGTGRTGTDSHMEY